MTAFDMSLQAYALCPSRTPANCNFGTNPVASDDVGAVFRCATCGLGVTRPAMPDTSGLYSDRTSQNFLPYYPSLVDRLKWLVFNRTARSILSRAPRKLQLLIDFGCGNGALANAFANQLQGRARVVGMDFFEDSPTKIGGANYAAYPEMTSFLGEADVVTCFHALEHDDDAPAFLAQLKSLLRPGGLLVVEVPNIDCVWTPWFGRSCDNWALPFHRLHFSRQALRQAVEAAGFHVTHEENALAATTANSIAKLLGVPFGGLSLSIALLLYPAQWLTEMVSGRPSALRIYATSVSES